MIRQAALVAFALVLAVTVYATVVPISMRPNSGHLHSERVLAYLALGATMAAAFPRKLLRVTIVVVGIACGLEVLQTFIPTRDGRAPDAVEKSAGALGGVALAWACNRAASTLKTWFLR